MNITLHYQGPLKSNAGRRDKHLIREALHPQLAQLWEHEPLNGVKDRFLDPQRKPDNPPGGNNLLYSVGGHRFACIVSSRLHTTAALDIKLLRPERPGGLVGQSGDIDNRLKTLLDALTIPQHENSLPDGFAPQAEQMPFFCLLEDDALVTSLSVEAERWLHPTAASSSEVIAIIRATTSTRIKTTENFDFD